MANSSYRRMTVITQAARPVVPGAIRLVVPTKLKVALRRSAYAALSEDVTLLPEAAATKYRAVCQLLNTRGIRTQSRLMLEQYKLLLLEAHLTALTEGARLTTQAMDEEDRLLAERKTWRYKLRVACFTAIAAIGLIQAAIEIFLGIRLMLLSFFPAIANPVLLAVSIGITVLNAAQFIFFEVTFLKQAMGVASRSEAKHLLDLHERQLYCAKKINVALTTNVNVFHTQTEREHEAYSDFAAAMNADIRGVKKPFFTEYKESKLKRLVRYAFVAFGGLMTIAGTYFAGISLLTAIAAPLIGTPVGWAMIGVLVVSALAYYAAMQASTTMQVFNSNIDQYNRLRQKLQNFETQDTASLNQIRARFRSVFKQGIPSAQPAPTHAATVQPVAAMPVARRASLWQAPLPSQPTLKRSSSSPSFGSRAA